MSDAAIIGAGKTGRGFLARLLSETQGAYGKIILIDRDEELVDRLNREKHFEVSFFGNTRKPQTVSGFEAYTWENRGLQEALNRCEVIFVSVGGQNLKDVGERLKRLVPLSARAVITAENASHPAETLKGYLGENTAIAEGTVFCTTTEAEGLNISSENYPYFQCDKDALRGWEPSCDRIRPVAAFGDFLMRKLYTYNAASCVIAYLGFVKGYTEYSDAANDAEILQLLDANYAATNSVLCREFGYDPEDQEEFAALSRAKFLDRTIRDTVARNGRDPQRKLAPGERIMGPIALLRKYGEDASVLERTAAAALLFDDGKESAWNRIRKEKSPGEILTDVCGLKPEDDSYGSILQKYAELNSARKSNKN